MLNELSASISEGLYQCYGMSVMDEVLQGGKGGMFVGKVRVSQQEDKYPRVSCSLAPNRSRILYPHQLGFVPLFSGRMITNDGSSGHE